LTHGNFPRHAFNTDRSATVTPSTNSAVGAAAFGRKNTVCLIATGRWMCSAADSEPAQADMISGFQRDLPQHTRPNASDSGMVAVGNSLSAARS